MQDRSASSSSALQRCRKRGAPRYPAKLRARITTWAIARRERGEWWTEISDAIGLPAQTLVRWAEASSSTSSEMKDAAQTVRSRSPRPVRIECVVAGDWILLHCLTVRKHALVVGGELEYRRSSA